MPKRTAVILTAGLIAMAGSMSFPPAARAASPFHLVGFGANGARVKSDGVRFASAVDTPYAEPARVFDTLRGRSFRPAPPAPGCGVWGLGGGLLGWLCPLSGKVLITDLATGAAREPVGWGAVEALDSEYSPCVASGIGRHWLQISCGQGTCCEEDPRYLNHRTGALIGPLRRPTYIDLDYSGLTRPVCAPLKAKHLVDWRYLYAPPFALEFDVAYSELGTTQTEIRLRQCGHRRAKTLSRCRFECVTPQLGSGYATWGDGDSVVAYFPQSRRRVVFHRPREAFDWLRLTAAAHTCNRVFAQWGTRIFVARLKRRSGAPRCGASPRPN